MDENSWNLLQKAKEVNNKQDLKISLQQQQQQHQHIKQNKCDSCDALIIDHYVSDGFIICTNCGVVIDTFIDSNAEWRCFNTVSGRDLSSIRCGGAANNLLPGTQLNTLIGGSDKRLQRIHQWTNLSPRERTLHQIYKEFEHIGFMNNLTKSIINMAIELYTKLHSAMENKNCGVKRCNVRHGLKAACLYFACKQLNVPRERKEIADIIGSNTKIVTKGCNFFLDIMGDDFIKMEPFKPEDFVCRFCQILNIPFQFQDKLYKIVQFVSSLELLSDNTPTSITSACILFLSAEYKLNITKDEIHEKCGNSQIIIIRTYNKIIKFRLEILDFLTR